MRFNLSFVSAAITLALVTGGAAQTSRTDLVFIASPIKLSSELGLPATLPFSYWREIPLLEASVNGNLLRERTGISTGLNALTVSNEAYARDKVQALKTQYGVSAMENTVEAPAATVKLLQIGNFQIQDLPFAIHDTSIQLLQKNRADAPAVWLGAPFLFSYQATFDFPNRVLILESHKSPLPKEEQKVELPLVLVNNRPFVKVQAGTAKAFLALIDTGSPGTLIPSEIAAKLKIKPETTVPTRKSSGAETSVGLGVLASLKIGVLEERNVRVGFLNPNAPVSFDKKFAVIGMNILKKYRVCFNAEKKKIVFLPPKKPDAETKEPTENP